MKNFIKGFITGAVLSTLTYYLLGVKKEKEDLKIYEFDLDDLDGGVIYED